MSRTFILMSFLLPFGFSAFAAPPGCEFSIGYVHPSIHSVETRLTEELGPQYSGLSRNPGIVEKIDDFITFAQAHITAESSPEQILGLYREKLGRVKLFRGLALTADQAAGILKDGLASGFIYREGGTDELGVMKFESMGLVATKAEYASGLKGAAKSIFAATASDWGLAKYVANTSVTDSKNQKIYLFEFEVWNADIVSVSDQEKLFFLRIPPSDLSIFSETYPSPYDPYIPADRRPWWDW